MRFLLSLIIPERNVENGYDYWSNYSDKSTMFFAKLFIQRSFFRSCFLFQQNLEWEKAILGQLVENMGKNDAPAVLQRHFPTSGILQRSNHASQQRVVLPLSMMLGVHEQWFGHICCNWTTNKSFISRKKSIATYVNSVLQAVIVMNGVGSVNATSGAVHCIMWQMMI